MALPNEGAARSPVKTYEDLRATIADSGRVYGEEKIQRAYALAEKAHKGQRRLSGESYISHPLAVACLVVDLGLDTDSVVAALLHDSVEDTDTTPGRREGAVRRRRGPFGGRRDKAGAHQVFLCGRAAGPETCAKC